MSVKAVSKGAPSSSGSLSPIQRHKALREDAHAAISSGLDLESLGPTNRAAALRQYQIGTQKINEALNVTFSDEADRSVPDLLSQLPRIKLSSGVSECKLEKATSR